MYYANNGVGSPAGQEGHIHGEDEGESHPVSLEGPSPGVSANRASNFANLEAGDERCHNHRCHRAKEAKGQDGVDVAWTPCR